jgi:hypothetical protein
MRPSEPVRRQGDEESVCPSLGAALMAAVLSFIRPARQALDRTKTLLRARRPTLAAC